MNFTIKQTGKKKSKLVYVCHVLVYFFCAVSTALSPFSWVVYLFVYLRIIILFLSDLEECPPVFVFP